MHGGIESRRIARRDVKAVGAQAEPGPIRALVELNADADSGLGNGHRGVAVLGAEEIAIGHAAQRVTDKQRDANAAKLVIHAHVFAFFNFSRRVCIVRAIEPVIVLAGGHVINIVDGAVGVQIGPQLAVVVQVRPVIHHEAPAAGGRGGEIVGRIIGGIGVDIAYYHQLGIGGDIRRIELEQVLRGVEVESALVGKV